MVMMMICFWQKVDLGSLFETPTQGYVDMYWKLGELDAPYHLVPETADSVEQSARFDIRATLFPTQKKNWQKLCENLWGKNDRP